MAYGMQACPTSSKIIPCASFSPQNCPPSRPGFKLPHAAAGNFFYLPAVFFLGLFGSLDEGLKMFFLQMHAFLTRVELSQALNLSAAAIGRQDISRRCCSLMGFLFWSPGRGYSIFFYFLVWFFRHVSPSFSACSSSEMLVAQPTPPFMQHMSAMSVFPSKSDLPDRYFSPPIVFSLSDDPCTPEELRPSTSPCESLRRLRLILFNPNPSSSKPLVRLAKTLPQRKIAPFRISPYRP